MDPAELEAAIAEAPDDPEPYLVYADWLQASGDPRGTLIVLQHHGRDREADALIEEHRAHFLGALAAFAPPGGEGRRTAERKLELSWHLGFIREARIGWPPYGRGQARREAVEAVEALLALPSSRFLRHLAIESVPAAGGAPDFRPFLDAIAGAARPPPLRSLFVGRSGASWTIGPIGGLLRACPELRHLTLRGGALSLGELHHPALRAFGIESQHLSRQNLVDLRAASWPRLERLELSFHARERPPECDAADLAALLGGDNLPSLRHLGVLACPFADDLARALARSPLLPRLHGLDLSGGALTHAGVAAMARSRLAFSHLAQLELAHNQLDDAARATARGLAKHVHVGLQEPPPPPPEDDA